jgi:hypothetical protein
MRETTAEIWIGPAQGSSWSGTRGGLNATHLLLLRENSRPAWMLMPGSFHRAKPPVRGKPKVWIPTSSHPLEDALLLFSVLGARIPEVCAVLREFEKSRSHMRLDLDSSFPRGLPQQVYASNQRHLQGWHFVANIGDYSFAKKDLDSLRKYKGIDVEVRRTSSVHRGTFK